MRSEDDGIKKSNRGGWHSSGNIFSETAPCFAQLRKYAMGAVADLCGKTGASAELAKLDTGIRGWMNINGQGAFNAPHTHSGYFSSGVYYVSQPDVDEGTSGMIEFLDPRPDLPNWRILNASTFAPKMRFRPAEGELILFPSYLTHWVYPDDVDAERVSIAFNIALQHKN